MATYTVKKGDTLSDIAKQFGTTYQEIAKQNGISNPNIIHPGQVLNIGETKTETPKTETPTTPTTPTTPQGDSSPKPKEFEYEDFTYGDYEKSDVVKQAEAMLQQQMVQKPGEYTSPWQAHLDETLNKILNREKFSYDLNGDALYQQYKDQFANQGKQASMDVMGQAAAMTGGYGNSYAQTVGQQTYQGYLQQLNDKVPELYQLALNQYNQEGQDLYNQYGLYADRESQDYGRYRDSVSDYNAELARLTDEARYQGEMDYNKYIDGRNYNYGQYMDDKNFDYGQFIDTRNYDYQLDRDAKTDADKEKQSAYDTAMAMISLGVTPSEEMLEKAGLSSADVKAMVNKVLANEKKKVSSSSSSGSKSTYTPKPADPDPKPTGFTGSSYDDAIAYMTKNGVPNGAAAGMMTNAEWSRRKASYKNSGIGGTEVKNYSTYKEYITDYVEYQIAQNKK